MKVLGDKRSQSLYAAEMDVPLARCSVAGRPFSLPQAEYRRCSAPDHLGAVTTSTDDARRITINVETIGDGLLVQNYIAEEAGLAYCRMISISGTFAARSRTQVKMLREPIPDAVDVDRSRDSNLVLAHASDVFTAFLAGHSLSLEDAATACQAAGSDHNARETPLFAAGFAPYAKTQVSGASL